MANKCIQEMLLITVTHATTFSNIKQINNDVNKIFVHIALLYGTSYSILLTHMISLFKMNSFSFCLSKYDKLYDEWCCKLKNNIYSLKKEDANEKCQKFSR